MVDFRRRQALALPAAVLATAALPTGLARPALAQASFPAKPITLIVPFPAGGTTDSQMRVLAAEASQVFAQQVLIENRPGAGSTLGASAVARARPDGYLLTQLSAPCLRLPFMQPMNYDVAKDFTPILHLTGYLFGICVRADSPWRSWADFVADAKRRPGAITVGTTGANGTPHLGVVQLAEREGIQLGAVADAGAAQQLAQAAQAQLAVPGRAEVSAAPTGLYRARLMGLTPEAAAAACSSLAARGQDCLTVRGP